MKKLLITKRLTALLWALVLTLMPMSLMADNTPLLVEVKFQGGSFAGEEASKAFDGITTNKWCGEKQAALNGAHAYVQVQLAEKSKLDYYYLYTGNDINYKDDDSQQQRNPKEWKLYAKVNEGDEWTLISHVTDAGLPTTVSTRSNNYKIDAAYQNIEYNYLRFEILQVEQGDIFEIGEICFISCNHTFGSDDICTECGYKKQQEDDFINVATTIQLWNAIQANARAKVRLTADFALSDINKDGETYCETFYGTIDGNGHTIKGDPVADIRSRTYMFSKCSGATIKNLTFKGIRVNSDDDMQGIITSVTRDNCVFENITFDNVHAFSDDGYVGSVASWAEDCTFKDITVKNSDFTTDASYSGAIVGNAKNCKFTNIKVENCESTADNDMAGGVTGWADKCEFNNVDISGGEIEAKENYAGGVSGYAYECKFISCLNSAKVLGDDYVGGIVGNSSYTDIIRCTNSGTINHRNFSEFVTDVGLGGIVGKASHGTIEQCSNYGEYPSLDEPCGGIVGYAEKMTINNCYCAVAPIIHRGAWGGIVGACKSCKVTNTFSSEYHCFGVKEYCEDMDPESGNNFYFNFNTQDYKGLEYPDCEKHGFDAGGMLAYIMNNSRENLAAGISPWEQELGIADPRLGDRGYYHTRKIKNPYGTVCFPFPVKSDDRISFYEFVRATESRGNLVMGFRYVSDVAAGKSALFYAPEVNDKPSDESLVEICFNNAGSDFESEPYEHPYWVKWELIGTFETKVFEGEDAKRIYYLSDNQFHNARKTTIYPYHAYLVGPSIQELSAKTITFSLEDEDGSVTALRYDIENDTLQPVLSQSKGYDNDNGKAYNIMGSEVGEGYKGIVIKNGKKTLSPALSR